MLALPLVLWMIVGVDSVFSLVLKCCKGRGIDKHVLTHTLSVGREPVANMDMEMHMGTAERSLEHERARRRQMNCLKKSAESTVVSAHRHSGGSPGSTRRSDAVCGRSPRRCS